MSARPLTRWLGPLALLTVIVALNIAVLAARSAERAEMRAIGLVTVRPPEDVSAMTVWNGRVFAGGRDGLSTLDVDRGEAQPEDFDGALAPRHVRALLAEGDTLWIGQETGLVRVDAAGPHIMGTGDGLPSVRIRCLALDRAGRLWAGTVAGVAILEQGRVTRVLTEDDGLADDVVNAIAEDADGRIWLGSYDAPEGGVTVMAPLPDDVSGPVTVVARFTTTDGLPHPSVTCILPEPDGTIWVGTGFHDRGGLARFSAPEGTGPVLVETYEQPDGLAGPKVRSLHRSATGVLWIGSERDGIALWPALGNGGGAAIATVETGLSDNEVKCMLPLTDERMLLGTRNGITIVRSAPEMERAVLGGTE